MAFLSFYREKGLDEIFWDDEARVNPLRWGLGHGLFLERYLEEQQGLFTRLVREVWRDRESFLDFLGLLNDLNDQDATRILVWYCGGPGIAGTPGDLTGESITFGRDLLYRFHSEQDPWKRILLLRGFSMVANRLYSQDEIMFLAQVARREGVPIIAENIVGILSVHVRRIPEAWTFLIGEATQRAEKEVDRRRQIAAARMVCYRPEHRDDPATLATAIDLLRRDGDPELQDIALEYLNRVRGKGQDYPDLSTANETAVSYFKELVLAADRLKARRSLSSDGERTRRFMVEKAATFDMPQAAEYVESILCDPQESVRVKEQAFSGMTGWNNSRAAWSQSLSRVGEDPRVETAIRVKAYTRLSFFIHRQAESDRAGAAKAMIELLQKMQGDPTPDLRIAADSLLRHAREAGILP